MEVRKRVNIVELKLTKPGLELHFPLVQAPLSSHHPAPTPPDSSSKHFPMAWEWALTTAPSTVDYSRGFGGRYGIEEDKRDKAALGYDYKGETEKHESQRGELGLERREAIVYMEPSFCTSWKLTQRTQNMRFAGSGRVKSLHYMYGGRWGETHRDGEESSKLRSRTQEGDQREGVIEEWVKMDRLGDGKSVIWLWIWESPLLHRERLLPWDT